MTRTLPRGAPEHMDAPPRVTSLAGTWLGNMASGHWTPGTSLFTGPGCCTMTPGLYFFFSASAGEIERVPTSLVPPLREVHRDQSLSPGTVVWSQTACLVYNCVTEVYSDTEPTFYPVGLQLPTPQLSPREFRQSRLIALSIWQHLLWGWGGVRKEAFSQGHSWSPHCSIVSKVSSPGTHSGGWGYLYSSIGSLV